MKLLTTLSFILVLAGSLTAQSTINRGDVFQPGDEYAVGVALSIPETGPSGANVTWDFSTVEIDTPSIGGIVTAQPDTTAYGDDYPTSNIVNVTSFAGLSFYQYMTASNDRIEVDGEVFPGFLVSQSIYSDPQTLLEFPLTYQTSWQDDFAYNLSFIGSGITYDAEGNVDCVVDGYGTVMLPHATFDDAIRIKMISFSLDTTSFGTETESNRTYDTTYVWMSPSYSGPLCAHTTSRQIRTAYFITPDTVISDSETIIDASFSLDPSSEQTSSTNEVVRGSHELSITPNPFEDLVRIEFDLENPQTVDLLLHDVHGRVVRTETFDASGGKNSRQLSLGALPAGMYVAILRTTNGADVQKLMRIGAGR